MALKGAAEAKARARAIKQIFKPVALEWTEQATLLAKRYAPRRTGKLQSSIRRKNASQRKASIQGIYYGAILSKGSKAHDIKAKKVGTLKFEKGGQTFFRKKVHRRGLPPDDFARRARGEALRRVPLAQRLYDLWNRAA
jgi:hypothetical protein